MSEQYLAVLFFDECLATNAVGMRPYTKQNRISCASTGSHLIRGLRGVTTRTSLKEQLEPGLQAGPALGVAVRLSCRTILRKARHI
jgi:hypothetical protein